MKIRTKLLITFLSAILLPIVLTISIFSLYLSNKAQDTRFVKTDINRSTSDISAYISSRYGKINDYNSFDDDVKGQIKAYSFIFEYIEITDLEGTVIYNSRERGRVGKNIDMNKLTYHSNDIFNYSFNREDSDYYLKIAKPFIVNNSIKGFILFKQNPYTFYEYAKGIAYSILWIGAGSVMLVIVFFSWLISRGIIIPLKKLTDATEHISKGNLDFEIDYKKGDEFGSLCLAFETMRDRLKDSLDKQVEYENSRKELIASISHDLRTPLTSIKGYVEGLKDGVVKDPEKFSKYLEVIYNKTESVNRLIDDLFEYSKLDMGIMEINKQVVEGSTMLLEIASNIRFDIEKEHIAFNAYIDFPPFYVEADRQRIEGVINNIVSNALRYAASTIELKGFVMDNKLFVCIKDDGCGIKDEEKSKIFERFFRGEKSRSLKTGGAGLGLAIAKKIIEEHSGAIWVESAEGAGSTFCFTLPQAKQKK